MNSGEFVRWLGGLPNLVGSYNYLLSSYIELIKIVTVFSREYIQCYCHFSSKLSSLVVSVLLIICVVDLGAYSFH